MIFKKTCFSTGRENTEKRKQYKYRHVDPSPSGHIQKALETIAEEGPERL